MSEREYGGYPESCLRQGLFQLEGEQVIAIVTDLLSERDRLEASWSRCEERCTELRKLEPKIERMYELQAQHTEAYGMVCQERDTWKRRYDEAQSHARSGCGWEKCPHGAECVHAVQPGGGCTLCGMGPYIVKCGNPLCPRPPQLREGTTPPSEDSTR